MRGYGTKFVWNSVMSTLRAPSKRVLLHSFGTMTLQKVLSLGRPQATVIIAKLWELSKNMARTFIWAVHMTRLLPQANGGTMKSRSIMEGTVLTQPITLRWCGRVQKKLVVEKGLHRAVVTSGCASTCQWEMCITTSQTMSR